MTTGMMETEKCIRCEGCGQIANDKNGTPWVHWLELPVKSAAAMIGGIVRPMPCPVCNGAGRVAARLAADGTDGANMIALTDTITVRLVQHCGGDTMLAAAARVSVLGQAVIDGTAFEPGELEGLLRYLMQHCHGSPFEHGSMTFFVHAPIFVFREWHRHRVGFSYNEESARYRPLKPVFWRPSFNRRMMDKPGSKAARPQFETGTAQQHLDAVTAMTSAYACAYRVYVGMLNRGVAREVARAVLPVGIYSSMWVTCNPRSLMHFLSLRTHREDAKFISYPQAEIEQAAVQMETLAGAVWPVTLRLFNELGRVAP